MPQRMHSQARELVKDKDFEALLDIFGTLFKWNLEKQDDRKEIKERGTYGG